MIIFNYFSDRDDIPPKNPKDRQAYFLRKAAEVATKSIMTHKHGSIIVHGDTILSEGWNQYITYYDHSFSIHAEIDAIQKYRKKIKNNVPFAEVELYVVRIGTNRMNNCLKYSKPCENCQKLIKRFGIPKAYYSTSDDFESYFKNL
jgi:tRNA(Arg) A34 adenosine deaminase TadA